ncbi:hypothetical protein DU80_07105 [Methanosarcina mazei]|uniref:CHAT domain-containing protein n=2 Tax=Methanosarcina mazei TaxID=2209 RepID=A0A0F8S9T7_METMZ|nr:hypothetical protein DU47_12890 [Methanosarcina mazei]KKH86890.1 hypothetical protein DU80_07105 [Methanosarcina mazei]
MITYPPPAGDLLTPVQRNALHSIEKFLIQNEFDSRRINPHLSDLTDKMVAACISEEDQRRMMEELDRYVRWRRLHGYWLTFLFQQAMRQVNSLYFMAACQLYAEAQINANEDLLLSSLENAYNASEQLLAMHENEGEEQLRRVAGNFHGRMRRVYGYYRQWYTSRPYCEINPLTEHLYSEKTFFDLWKAFPEQKKPRSLIVPDDYLEVISQCKKTENVYCCIVARRFLGILYQGQGEWEEAQEQFRLGLEEAQKVSLETEIGHFHRLYGFALSQTGQLQEAARQFEKAIVYESHPAFSYWQALSMRELGDLRMKMTPFVIDLSHTPVEIELAMRAYKAGRLMFEGNIGMGIVPVSRAIKQQFFRSYTDNALQAAVVLKNNLEILAEIEAAGPRYVTELVAEGAVINALPADGQKRFRQARAIFHEHLTTFNEKKALDQDFSQYVASVKGNREARRFYLETRTKLTGPLTLAQVSDKIAQKVLALRLPNVMFLLFHVGEEQTFGTLLDCGLGKMWTGTIGFGERYWRAQHESYQKALEEAKGLPDPSVGMIQLLDKLLASYEDVLNPLLEPFLPLLKDRHLKIFPRLFLNEVPLHALSIDGKRLIEYCNVSYAQTLGLFLRVHQYQDQPHKSTSSYRMLMICDDKSAPHYQGAIQHLNHVYTKNLRVVQNPSWQEFVASLRSCPTDIFFACHGKYNPDDPAASKLFFSKSDEVTFSKLFSELDLAGCQCVTLGACESGLGRTIVTAEYLGLPIAFFAAGVRYVIGSLWEVNQLTAAMLLSHHYELLQTGQYTIPSALNEAQRVIMQISKDQVIAWIRANLPNRVNRLEPLIRRMRDPPFSNPYYWAGFYVAGDV